MIFDARNDATPLDREARFVIVGAGPAGMTLADSLSAAGPVLLLESGGFEDDPEVRALHHGESDGMPYCLSASRAHRFGGTSNLWAGWCAPFDADDFRERDWVPDSGWPLSEAELRPYYARTAALLNLAGADFDAMAFVARENLDWPFDRRAIVPSIWHFGAPTMAFGTHWRQRYTESDTVTTLLHANLADIRLDSGHGLVREVCVRTLNGRQGRIRAETLILACGGIETPRILLNADSQLRCGIGNTHDLVGRYFMEHPHVPIAALPEQSTHWYAASRDRKTARTGYGYMLAAGLAPSLRRELGVLNARAHVYRTPAMGRDTPRLGLFLEQAPNPHSRVALSDATDALGLRRARLTWQLNKLDRLTQARTASALLRELALGSAAEGQPRRLHEIHPGELTGTNHHMGTTRMARNPARGVVDADCRVHGIDNLYIAGSSVFPTGSWANPTFTLLALALRLADHLRRRYGLDPPARPTRALPAAAG